MRKASGCAHLTPQFDLPLGIADWQAPDGRKKAKANRTITLAELGPRPKPKRKAQLESQLGLDLVSVIARRRRRGRPKGSKTDKGPNTYVWSDLHAVSLSEAVLNEAMSTIRSRQAPEKDKQDAIDWAMQPLIEEGLPRPFSFQACAMLCGLDAEVLQQSLREHLDYMPTREFKESLIDALMYGIEMEVRAIKKGNYEEVLASLLTEETGQTAETESVATIAA